jgi:hypothetical protein
MADKKRRIFLCWLWPYKGKEKYFCMVNSCCGGLSTCCALYCRIMPWLYCGRRNAQINVGLQTTRTGNTVNPADHQDWEYC